MEWLDIMVREPVEAMVIRIWSYIPRILGALLILVIGWVLARAIEAIVVRFLKAVKLDSAADKAGVRNILAQGDIHKGLSEVLGVVVYWLAMLVVIVTAVNALNLTVAATLLSQVVRFVPNVIVAVFVLVLGAFTASFVSTVIRTSTRNIGLKRTKIFSDVAQISIIVLSAAIAMEQLHIGQAIVVMAVNIIIFSIGLGLALAFGLGCKDLAGQSVREWINNLKK